MSDGTQGRRTWNLSGKTAIFAKFRAGPDFRGYCGFGAHLRKACRKSGRRLRLSGGPVGHHRGIPAPEDFADSAIIADTIQDLEWGRSRAPRRVFTAGPARDRA